MHFLFLSSSSLFFPLWLRWGGGGVVRVGGEGRCSGRSGTGGDCSSYWLEPEGVVLLSPCDAYRMFHSEWMLVARPTNVLNIQY